MNEPETYDCNYRDGCKLVVKPGYSGPFIFVAVGLGGKEVIVIPESEDIPRLIAQLTAALPAKPLGNTEQSPPKDTMEVRIAVVTLADQTGKRFYKAAGGSSWGDEISLATAMNGCHEEYTQVAFVTAHVPPPRPAIHEVEGKVEVSDE